MYLIKALEQDGNLKIDIFLQSLKMMVEKKTDIYELTGLVCRLVSI